MLSVFINGHYLLINQVKSLAIYAFKGDVYTGLDADTLSEDELDFQKHLSILSGLYGLLRPLDLMQAYRPWELNLQI